LEMLLPELLSSPAHKGKGLIYSLQSWGAKEGHASTVACPKFWGGDSAGI
jgi:hypothetical protein